MHTFDYLVAKVVYELLTEDRGFGWDLNLSDRQHDGAPAPFTAAQTRAVLNRTKPVLNRAKPR